MNSFRKEFVASAVQSKGYPLFSRVKRGLVARDKGAGWLLHPFFAMHVRLVTNATC